MSFTVEAILGLDANKAPPRHQHRGFIVYMQYRKQKHDKNQQHFRNFIIVSCRVHLGGGQ